MLERGEDLGSYEIVAREGPRLRVEVVLGDLDSCLLILSPTGKRTDVAAPTAGTMSITAACRV